MATNSYERLRTAVETLNRRDRALPEGTSANVSQYQQYVMECMLAGFMIREGHGQSKTRLAVHGSHASEMARVLEAYAMLMRNGVREFQP